MKTNLRLTFDPLKVGNDDHLLLQHATADELSMLLSWVPKKTLQKAFDKPSIELDVTKKSKGGLVFVTCVADDDDGWTYYDLRKLFSAAVKNVAAWVNVGTTGDDWSDEAPNKEWVEKLDMGIKEAECFAAQLKAVREKVERKYGAKRSKERL